MCRMNIAGGEGRGPILHRVLIELGFSFSCAIATVTSFSLTGYASLVYLYGTLGAVKKLKPLRLMLALPVLHLYRTSYKKAVLS
jgi:hypothetical protein